MKLLDASTSDAKVPAEGTSGAKEHCANAFWNLANNGHKYRDADGARIGPRLKLEDDDTPYAKVYAAGATGGLSENKDNTLKLMKLVARQLLDEGTSSTKEHGAAAI